MLLFDLLGEYGFINEGVVLSLMLMLVEKYYCLVVVIVENEWLLCYFGCWGELFWVFCEMVFGEFFEDEVWSRFEYFLL